MILFKNFYIFAMRKLLHRFVNPKQFLLKPHYKGVVLSILSSAKWLVIFANPRGLCPIFINFFKLFSNAKIRKQFTSARNLHSNASYTKRSNPNTFRIFGEQWLKMVQNFNKAYQGFNEFQVQQQNLSLRYWQKFARSLRNAPASCNHVCNLNKIYFSDCPALVLYWCGIFYAVF